jgi:hypothetical protein
VCVRACGFLAASSMPKEAKTKAAASPKKAAAKKAPAAKGGKKKPTGPKKPLSAYMIFASEKRDGVKKENPGASPCGAVCGARAGGWRVRA